MKIFVNGNFDHRFVGKAVLITGRNSEGTYINTTCLVSGIVNDKVWCIEPGGNYLSFHKSETEYNLDFKLLN